MSNLEIQILDIVKQNPTISNRDIGIIVGKHRTTVEYYLKKNNIYRDRIVQQKINNTDRNSKIIITDIAKQILTGTLLGDSHISKYNREGCPSVRISNSCICTGHSLKQKDYLLYLEKLLKEQNLTVHYREDNLVHKSVINNRPVITYGECYLSVVRNIEFNKWRDIWYPNDIKIVPEEFMKYLSPLAIAIWFMDDGSKHSSSYYIHTNGFDVKSQNLLQHTFFDKYGIKTKLHNAKNSKMIYISAESRDRFTLLIKPYICKCMEYKLHKTGSE